MITLQVDTNLLKYNTLWITKDLEQVAQTSMLTKIFKSMVDVDDFFMKFF
jgi:hypothetical protein